MHPERPHVRNARRRARRKGIVVAMGAASGDLVARSFYDRLYSVLFTRRWGHLVEMPYPAGAEQLRHGLMDAAYTKHYASAADCTIPSAAEGAAAAAVPPPPPDITFTATTSATGSLLVGERPAHARAAPCGIAPRMHVSVCCTQERP